MARENSQNDSQPIHRNNDPDETLQRLSDSDIQELVFFFSSWTRSRKGMKRATVVKESEAPTIILG
jgi:hypothetical protein